MKGIVQKSTKKTTCHTTVYVFQINHKPSPRKGVTKTHFELLFDLSHSLDEMCVSISSRKSQKEYCYYIRPG